MKELPQSRIENMGLLNNAIVEAVDKCGCSILEVMFVLRNIHDRLDATALLPKIKKPIDREK
jgi:hypothetical protein